MHDHEAHVAGRLSRPIRTPANQGLPEQWTAQELYQFKTTDRDNVHGLGFPAASPPESPLAKGYAESRGAAWQAPAVFFLYLARHREDL